jgi:hypothetical protein
MANPSGTDSDQPSAGESPYQHPQAGDQEKLTPDDLVNLYTDDELGSDVYRYFVGGLPRDSGSGDSHGGQDAEEDMNEP